METINGDFDKGGPPPPSPLTGCYLLIIVGEPHSEAHKDIILQRIAKGLLSWNVNECLVDLEKELEVISEQGLEGEEARYGERLIQFASENLVTEILIHPMVSTLVQCMRNLLSSFTRHRHIIHAGYTFAANGSWALQDGTFSYADFTEAFQEIEAQRVIHAYENGITLDLHCSPEGDWCKLSKETFTKACNVRVNPTDVLTCGSPSITGYINYISQFLIPTSLENLLQCSDVVGNIRFSRPTLYVFPGGQGDAALFGINGFNMLLDGGFSRKACFWDFVRHLDRLDAVLMTRLNNSNIGGISSILRRKRKDAVYPQIGHFFCNIQDRKTTISPDGDKDKDPLLLDLLDEGQEIISNLRHLNLNPQICYRDSEPINLYHKVGHGTLNMYVLNPAKDSKEVKEFCQKWNQSDQKLFSKQQREFSFPIQNLISIAVLLIWQPANINDTITRILYPGSCPQQKIFEGLDRVKNIEYIKHSVCSEKSLFSKFSSKKPTKNGIIEKIILKDKPGEKKEKLIDNNINALGTEIKERSVKKSDSTESDKTGYKKVDESKIINEADEKIKIKPKISKTKTESQQRKKSTEKKDSPTTPKRSIDHGEIKKSVSTPAKSTKDANNRKVLENKTRSMRTSVEPVAKPDRKPVSKRPKGLMKAPISPAKRVINGVQKPDNVSKKGRLDKEGTTDSSTVSTPSADQDSLKKDMSNLTQEEIQQIKAQELADLKEEQEAVKEIEAVFRKGEVYAKGDDSLRKVKSISMDEDKSEKEEYLIIEKEEFLDEKEVKEGEIQKLTRDSEESEKQRNLISDDSIQKREHVEDTNRESTVAASKDTVVTSQDEKVEVLSLDRKSDKEAEEIKDIVESQPDEKISANIKSGDTTTAPTLPEDERIPLDEIKEDNGYPIEEKYAKEDTKEKGIPVIQLPPKTFDAITKLPGVVGIRLDKQSHIRDIVKTPDEVADLPVHEEVDYEFAHESKTEIKTNDAAQDITKSEDDVSTKEGHRYEEQNKEVKPDLEKQEKDTEDKKKKSEVEVLKEDHEILKLPEKEGEEQSKIHGALIEEDFGKLVENDLLDKDVKSHVQRHPTKDELEESEKEIIGKILKINGPQEENLQDVETKPIQKQDIHLDENESKKQIEEHELKKDEPEDVTIESKKKDDTKQMDSVKEDDGLIIKLTRQITEDQLNEATVGQKLNEESKIDDVENITEILEQDLKKDVPPEKITDSQKDIVTEVTKAKMEIEKTQFESDIDHKELIQSSDKTFTHSELIKEHKKPQELEEVSSVVEEKIDESKEEAPKAGQIKDIVIDEKDTQVQEIEAELLEVKSSIAKDSEEDLSQSADKKEIIEEDNDSLEKPQTKKLPKDREEVVIKIVASVAEVLKSDAPLEDFEGKLPLNFETCKPPYVTELRETHITTTESSDEPLDIKYGVFTAIPEELPSTTVSSTEQDISNIEKLSEPLSSTEILIDKDSEEEKDDTDEQGTVQRMLVTASSEDGGEETEICPVGTIIFSKSSESSGRSSPEKSQESKKSSIIDTISDSVNTVKQIVEGQLDTDIEGISSGKDLNLKSDTDSAQEKIIISTDQDILEKIEKFETEKTLEPENQSVAFELSQFKQETTDSSIDVTDKSKKITEEVVRDEYLSNDVTEELAKKDNVADGTSIDTKNKPVQDTTTHEIKSRPVDVKEVGDVTSTVPSDIIIKDELIHKMQDKSLPASNIDITISEKHKDEVAPILKTGTLSESESTDKVIEVIDKSPTKKLTDDPKKMDITEPKEDVAAKHDSISIISETIKEASSGSKLELKDEDEELKKKDDESVSALITDILDKEKSASVDKEAMKSEESTLKFDLADEDKEIKKQDNETTLILKADKLDEDKVIIDIKRTVEIDKPAAKSEVVDKQDDVKESDKHVYTLREDKEDEDKLIKDIKVTVESKESILKLDTLKENIKEQDDDTLLEEDILQKEKMVSEIKEVVNDTISTEKLDSISKLDMVMREEIKTEGDTTVSKKDIVEKEIREVLENIPPVEISEFVPKSGTAVKEEIEKKVDCTTSEDFTPKGTKEIEEVDSVLDKSCFTAQEESVHDNDKLTDVMDSTESYLERSDIRKLSDKEIADSTTTINIVKLDSSDEKPLRDDLIKQDPLKSDMKNEETQKVETIVHSVLSDKYESIDKAKEPVDDDISLLKSDKTVKEELKDIKVTSFTDVRSKDDTVEKTPSIKEHLVGVKEVTDSTISAEKLDLAEKLELSEIIKQSESNESSSLESDATAKDQWIDDHKKTVEIAVTSDPTSVDRLISENLKDSAVPTLLETATKELDSIHGSQRQDAETDPTVKSHKKPTDKQFDKVADSIESDLKADLVTNIDTLDKVTKPTGYSTSVTDGARTSEEFISNEVLADIVKETINDTTSVLTSTTDELVDKEINESTTDTIKTEFHAVKDESTYELRNQVDSIGDSKVNEAGKMEKVTEITATVDTAVSASICDIVSEDASFGETEKYVDDSVLTLKKDIKTIKDELIDDVKEQMSDITSVMEANTEDRQQLVKEIKDISVSPVKSNENSDLIIKDKSIAETKTQIHDDTIPILKKDIASEVTLATEIKKTVGSTDKDSIETKTEMDDSAITILKKVITSEETLASEIKNTVDSTDKDLVVKDESVEKITKSTDISSYVFEDETAKCESTNKIPEITDTALADIKAHLVTEDKPTDEIKKQFKDPSAVAADVAIEDNIIDEFKKQVDESTLVLKSDLVAKDKKTIEINETTDNEISVDGSLEDIKKDHYTKTDVVVENELLSDVKEAIEKIKKDSEESARVLKTDIVTEEPINEIIQTMGISTSPTKSDLMHQPKLRDENEVDSLNVKECKKESVSDISETAVEFNLTDKEKSLDAEIQVDSIVPTLKEATIDTKKMETVVKSELLDDIKKQTDNVTSPLKEVKEELLNTIKDIKESVTEIQGQMDEHIPTLTRKEEYISKSVDATKSSVQSDSVAIDSGFKKQEDDHTVSLKQDITEKEKLMNEFKESSITGSAKKSDLLDKDELTYKIESEVDDILDSKPGAVDKEQLIAEVKKLENDKLILEELDSVTKEKSAGEYKILDSSTLELKTDVPDEKKSSESIDETKEIIIENKVPLKFDEKSIDVIKEQTDDSVPVLIKDKVEPDDTINKQLDADSLDLKMGIISEKESTTKIIETTHSSSSAPESDSTKNEPEKPVDNLVLILKMDTVDGEKLIDGKKEETVKDESLDEVKAALDKVAIDIKSDDNIEKTTDTMSSIQKSDISTNDQVNETTQIKGSVTEKKTTVDFPIITGTDNISLKSDDEVRDTSNDVTKYEEDSSLQSNKENKNNEERNVKETIGHELEPKVSYISEEKMLDDSKYESEKHEDVESSCLVKKLDFLEKIELESPLPRPLTDIVEKTIDLPRKVEEEMISYSISTSQLNKENISMDKSICASVASISTEIKTIRDSPESSEIDHKEKDFFVKHQHISGSVTPPTAPVSPGIIQSDDVKSDKKQSEDSLISSTESLDTDMHPTLKTRKDIMTESFYGVLPDDDIEETYSDEHSSQRSTDPKDSLADSEKPKSDEKEKVVSHIQDLSEVVGTSRSSFGERTYLYEITKAKQSSIDKNESKKASTAADGDPTTLWGKPLGLPSPAPSNDNKGTPKKEKKLPLNVSVKNKWNENKKRSESPSKNKNKRVSPVYVDLTYVPHHGNSYYAYVDFFKMVRARYYVFSGIEPGREVYSALLEAKQTWEDKELEVTIIPTYDTDVLGYWVAENEELLTKCKIDLSPSASRCTINLQDHETSCSAYRLEF